MRLAIEDKRAISFYSIFITMLFLLALMASGCTAFNNLVKNNELTMQLATEAATARVLYEHPKWKSQTIKITDDAIMMIDTNAIVELTSLEAYVKSQIKWQTMLPEEQALVSTLISQVVKSLRDSFMAQGGNYGPEQMIEVRKVLIWVNQTAKRQP